jgi:mycothiol synthase
MTSSSAAPDGTAPDEATQRKIRELADAVERRDGAPPLSDEALAQLGRAGATHVVARDDDTVIGYAQRHGDTVELAGDAATAGALLDALGPLPPGTRVWAHGSRSPIEALLRERGFRPVRTLYQLRRTLDGFTATHPPDGVIVRPFVVGVDETSWLAVNAAAFAAHAEQGRWTLEDLLVREAEPWFDPAGFLLAERDSTLLGFHWTKVHADGTGEVYVLGIDPQAQGAGLGAVLLDAGLAYLAGRGCHEVLLYADADNTAALQLYESAGFGRVDADTQWLAQAQPAQSFN